MDDIVSLSQILGEIRCILCVQEGGILYNLETYKTFLIKWEKELTRLNKLGMNLPEIKQ